MLSGKNRVFLKIGKFEGAAEGPLGVLGLVLLFIAICLIL